MASPGPWRCARTPYLREIIDTLTDDVTTHIAFQKPVQCGGTTAGEIAMGAWVDMDPGPIMIVFSNEEATKKRMREEIIPLFRETPRLSQHLTAKKWDIKTGSLRLRSCEIHTGWAGSPASLASTSIRRVVLDEVDKYPAWTGKESTPMQLGEARTTTWGRRKKVYSVSTPTTPNGNICAAMENCGDRRDYCPKCVHCSQWIRPDWEHVHWDGMDEPDQAGMLATLNRLSALEVTAYYRCPHCSEDMDTRQFWTASKAGAWVSEGKSDPNDRPKSDSVGFRLSGLCVHPEWRGIQGAAIKFTQAKLKGLSELQGFYNSDLGLPFWGEDGGQVDPTLTVTQEKIWELAREGGERGQVPDWATVVVAGVDTGKRDHPYVVRAFGPDFRSALLDYGFLRTGEEVLELLDKQWPGVGGRTLQIRRLLIDSGGGRGMRNMSRTEEVYRLSQRDPGRIWATKGHGGGAPLSQPAQTRMIHYRPPGDRYTNTLDVRLTMLDTTYWKDLTATYINTGLWAPHKAIGRTYVQQVASEKKKLVRTVVKPDGTRVEDWRWQPLSVGLPNHMWDCEVLATVAAHLVGADQMEHEPFAVEGEINEDLGGWTPPSQYTRGGSWI